MRSVFDIPYKALSGLAHALFFPFYSLFSGKTGFTIFFPWISGWFAISRGQVFQVVAPHLKALEYFRHFVPREGDTIFDVGGELGFETRQFSAMVGNSGKVFVFECFPGHLRALEAIAARLKNVQVVARACWNTATDIEFFVGNTPGSNTAVPEAKGQHGQVLAKSDGAMLKVKAERLDDLWAALHARGPVDFLKMDIEGGEYEALEGAREMLKHTRYAVIAAYHMRDGVPTAARVDRILRASGFMTRVDENNHVYAWR